MERMWRVGIDHHFRTRIARGLERSEEFFHRVVRDTGIRAAVRGGRLRASFHLYTTEADVDLALEALTR